MFKRISYTIALQFTAFVFLLLVINGAIFLIADIGNAQRQMRFRLERMAEGIAFRFDTAVPLMPRGIPPGMRERMRVVDAEGNVLVEGMLINEIPFTDGKIFDQVMVQGEPYAILTEPIVRDGRTVGYVQVADVVRLPLGDLPERALIFLMVSGAISALTFFVGLFFARRSLKPAEQMMKRLEQFTQDASHELKTPLAALSSSLDLALKNERYREGILSAKQDLRQVAVLVERLLELARLDKFVRADESIDLTSLIGESAGRFQSLAHEKHVVIKHELRDGVTVQGDAVLIRQVVENFLSNAIKFSKPAGGTVRVRLTSKALSVEDTGVGIAAETLPYIFNRFYQAEQSRALGGFGLGLALVKRIVELHGWTVKAHSFLGKGSTFTVHFGSQSHATHS
ncbi:MAG: HAMP domain-containing sensor histidine kinase [Candidatus Peregrinibacteria bacterium]